MRLFLARHAEAAEGSSVTPDRLRPLTPRGLGQARELGAWIGDRLEGSLALRSSSALRAVETTREICLGLPNSVEPLIEGELYQASARQLFEWVESASDERASLLIVGHNPSMAELAMRLSGSGDASLLEALSRRFPPAACAELLFRATSWAALELGAGELVGFSTPRH